jgi:DNA repair protein RecN (Recombination protein N)
MLTELRIRNFAIIESLVLPLGPGFNVLTGETGAGKSIVVGALSLLLGERATADVVRTGADRASVEGVFDVGDRPDMRDLLDARGIELDDALVVLKREVSSAGRTRAWINGSTVTAGALAEVGRRLVDLHGQHEAQSLLQPDSQRAVLDAFAGAISDVGSVRAAHERLASIRREIADLSARRADAAKRSDYLKHMAREIEEARLSPGEDAQLEEEARRLENAAEIRETSQALAAALDDEDAGVLGRLAHAGRLLQQLQRYDSTLSRLQEGFDSGFYAVESLSRELEEYAANLDLDPARLEEVRRRRDLLFRLTKKYGPALTDVIAAGSEARRELDLLDSGGFDLRELQERETAATRALAEAAASLTLKRQAAARRLARAVDEIFPELGIPDGRFVVQLSPVDPVTATGAEEVEFRVALNVGHDLRPLARVASGGELSRVMLALKTILAQLDQVPTLVFDEVDAGIGGKVGSQVGDLLRRVAASHQVFAITHLAQIAARAHRHILVTKGARAGVTAADVAMLDEVTRVAEVARMLGGDPESATSRAHAEELIRDAGAPVPARRQKHSRSGLSAGPDSRS